MVFNSEEEMKFKNVINNPTLKIHILTSIKLNWARHAWSKAWCALMERKWI